MTVCEKKNNNEFLDTEVGDLRNAQNAALDDNQLSWKRERIISKKCS